MILGARPAPGELVGAYEIERHLASGGMGDVYVARAVASGARVALKLLSDLSPAAASRFAREARIATRLSHPHIVRTLDAGRLPDGRPFLAMELLAGSDLAARLAARTVSAPDAVRVALQVCEALACAHAQRVVHRDLKPQNIFVREQAPGAPPHAVVLDFGIAREVDERGVTSTGGILGTWAYMSPEQARGERTLDHRTDLWSLGVVLYECLAGRLPFESESGPGILVQILLEEPPSLANLRPGLPLALIEAVETALRKSPLARFADAAAMRAALAAVDLAALGPVGPPAGAPRERDIAAAATARAGGLAAAATRDAATAVASVAGSATAPRSLEIRLTSVVFLRAVRDAVLLRAMAAELRGHVVALAGDDALVIFGAERWNGDEPQRALRLAAVASSAAQGVGVATGRVRSAGAHVSGPAVEAAVALAQKPGVRVDDTTREAARDALRVDRGPDGAARITPVARGGGGARATGAATALESGIAPLVGRELDLALLLRAAETARAELRPAGVAVIGASGSGKTRLAAEAAARLCADDPDAAVIVVHGDSARRDVPFAALRDALAAAVDPGLASVLSVPAGGDPVAALDRARVSLQTVLTGLAQRGTVLLVLDDAPWLDASSRAALRWVVETAADVPLCVWVLARPEGREEALAVVPGAAVLELGPLAAAAAEALVRAVVGSVPQLVIERAGGQPLLLEQLARLYKERGAASLTQGAELPFTIEAAVLAQLDALEPADREFAKRAAVFGQSFWAEGVAELGGDEAALPRLRRAGLVVPRARSRLAGARELGFRVGIVQEVAYGLWPAEQRDALHARAAAWLAGRAGAAAGEVARHWEAAGDAPRAAAAYVAAAEEAARVADLAAAVSHADRALALTEEPALRWRALRARDEVLQVGGDRAQQRAGLAQLAALAPALGPAAQIESAWRECIFARLASENDAARAAGLRAADLAAAHGDARAGAIAHRELAMQFASDGRFDDARAHAAQARAFAAAAQAPELDALAVGAEAFVLSEAGESAAALERFLASADGFARAGDRRREANARANAASLMLPLGRVEEATAELEAAIETARRVGNLRAVAAAQHNLGVARRVLGALEDARALQDRAAAGAAQHGNRRLSSAVATEQVYLALARSDEPAALAALAEQAEALADATGSPVFIAAARSVALRARARAGLDVRAALAAARRELEAVAHPTERAVGWAAVYEAGGRAPADLAAARAAAAQVLAQVRTEEDRPACLAYLRRRYLLGDEVAPAE